MKVLHDNYLDSQDELVDAITLGKIFIYPTDTIYGLGCDSTNREAVERIRELKKRHQKPFLVVAPRLSWIWEHCDVTLEMKRRIEERLPGRYAFFLKLKDSGELAYSAINPSCDGTIGVRVIDHPFQAIISEAGRPFVTTSVNFAEEPFAHSVADVPEAIKQGVDYCIDVGEIAGSPSTRVDFAH